MITYKKKEIKEDGTIIGQDAINCYVENIEQANVHFIHINKRIR